MEREVHICDYGCGQEAKYQFKNGNRCCSKSLNSCPFMREKNKLGLIEAWKDPKNKEKWKRKKGIIPWNKGVKNCFGEETLEQMRKKRPNFTPWNKGVENCFGEETLEQMSKSKKGKIPWNKFDIYKLKSKYPKLFEVEEIIENSNYEIQVRCKYCRKWFTPTYTQVYERIRWLIKNKFENRHSYFYCCSEHKELCEYHKEAVLEGYRKNKGCNRRGKSGHFFSKKNNKNIFFRSSYELAFFRILEKKKEVIKYEVAPFFIPYKDINEVDRNYIPDILIFYDKGQKELVEIKSEWEVNNPEVKVKSKAAEKFCILKKYKWSILTEKQIGLENIKEAFKDIKNRRF